jgi:hypothetical protein
MTGVGCSDLKSVDDRIRQEVAGEGRIVAFVEESSNAGKLVYEYEYIVIDTGADDPAESMRRQAEHLKKIGWIHGALKGAQSANFFSRELNTGASIRPVADFLKEWRNGEGLYPEQRAAQQIRAKVKEQSPYILLVLQPIE